eukprot:scaffold16358_cov54-Attheya_sp.AAC.7
MANIDPGKDDASGSRPGGSDEEDLNVFLDTLFDKSRGPYTCGVCKKLSDNHSVRRICVVPMAACWLGNLPTSTLDDLLHHYPAFEKEVTSSKRFVRSSQENKTFEERHARARALVLNKETEPFDKYRCNLCGQKMKSNPKTKKKHLCDFVSLPRPWLKIIFETRPDLVQDFEEDTINYYKKALALPDE